MRHTPEAFTRHIAQSDSRAAHSIDARHIRSIPSKISTQRIILVARTRNLCRNIIAYLTELHNGASGISIPPLKLAGDCTGRRVRLLVVGIGDDPLAVGLSSAHTCRKTGHV